jgi:hypothetical protein
VKRDVRVYTVDLRAMVYGTLESNCNKIHYTLFRKDTEQIQTVHTCKKGHVTSEKLRFVGLMVMKMWIVVFWVVMPCSNYECGYQHLGGTYCFLPYIGKPLIFLSQLRQL